MGDPFRTASTARHIVCPFCESGELVSAGPGFARCGSCGLPLLGSECGHPEMRELPDGVYHCPACGSEVLPVEIPGVRRRALDDLLHRVPSGTPSPLGPTRRTSA